MATKKREGPSPKGKMASAPLAALCGQCAEQFLRDKSGHIGCEPRGNTRQWREHLSKTLPVKTLMATATFANHLHEWLLAKVPFSLLDLCKLVFFCDSTCKCKFCKVLIPDRFQGGSIVAHLEMIKLNVKSRWSF